MTPTPPIPTVAELKRNGGRCLICGYRYERPVKYIGINNGVAHRAFHRQHVPELEPRLEGFASGDIRVDYQSPAWLHRLVYQRAKYLQRDQRYDFPQWPQNHGLEDDEFSRDTHALLLIEQPCLIVGAASLSWNLWSNAPASWCLNFIWIAGTWRRKGVLSRRWPLWRERYGDFIVEPPWSDAMNAFLLKHGVPNPLQAEYAYPRRITHSALVSQT